ncbi:MAG: preprotein translocase subunit SecE [Bdellovibrionaceae bacterium]|nr:preprotein translocase subunit SecE [Pseudobdellovibrionaceae bacterium]MDW8189514.1 preprotein translocase subunit SecE [Pseudobdellovibrionaceae bacterium]
MEKQIAKAITLSFAAAGAIVAVGLGLLLKSLAGAFGSIAVLMGYDAFRHGLPVVVGLAVFLALRFHPRAVGFSYEVMVELQRVVWPPQKDVRAMTIAVIFMVTIISVIIFLFDFLSALLLKYIVG